MRTLDTYRLVVLRSAACAAAVLMTLVADESGAHAADRLIGRATVIDGDTIEIHGERIRFNGIDAPESAQTCLSAGGREYRCGAASANALAEFLAKSVPASCDFVERDRYGRFVGTCTRADGAGVNEWMVENGHAFDWPRYSGGSYALSQELAERESRGLWQGSFDWPWDWRRGAREATAARQPSTESGCVIKGNINSKGERIFHSPGQRDYERTVIHEDRGQRWFCSQEEAIAAGWRPARR